MCTGTNKGLSGLVESCVMLHILINMKIFFTGGAIKKVCWAWAACRPWWEVTLVALGSQQPQSCVCSLHGQNPSWHTFWRWPMDGGRWWEESQDILGSQGCPFLRVNTTPGSIHQMTSSECLLGSARVWAPPNFTSNIVRFLPVSMQTISFKTLH